VSSSCSILTCGGGVGGGGGGGGEEAGVPWGGGGRGSPSRPVEAMGMSRANSPERVHTTYQR
jgi:hypothetical protein